MKYILVKREPLFQEVWNNESEKLVVSFTDKDFDAVLTPIFPELLARVLNRCGKIDKYDTREVILGLLHFMLKKDAKHNELTEVIEGLKAGGQALNFVIPPPVDDRNDCMTTSLLYKTQYSMAKKQWSAYYSRFYEKTPNNNDYLVQHIHRSDLHSIRSVDGKWFMRLSIGNKSKRIYLGLDENIAIKKRDIIIERIKNNEQV